MRYHNGICLTRGDARPGRRAERGVDAKNFNPARREHLERVRFAREILGHMEGRTRVAKVRALMTDIGVSKKTAYRYVREIEG